MQAKGRDDARVAPSEAALRVIMRRLREIMAEPADGQTRLDRIVHQVAGLMVAEVCSIYLKRQDGSLELFATEGLRPEAVHKTHMKRGEGLVGRIAETGELINLSEAQSHPAFSYRPETGEEIYHSFLGVPVLRSGVVLGVLTVQNRTPKEYSEDEVEALQTTAMVLAEHLVSGDVAGVNTAAEFSRRISHVVHGEPIAEGIALGHAVLHEPRVVVQELLAEDAEAEEARLETALEELRAWIDERLERGDMGGAGEHREVFETYRMFAKDRGWIRRMKEAVKAGLTAEAAVERVQNDNRARLPQNADAFWRDRLRDLDDLSDRLQRLLLGQPATSARDDLPADTILVARTLGPAELLDYDRARLRGLVVEHGGSSSHVAIVAKALGIPAIGEATGAVERIDSGDALIIDGDQGQVHVRPTSEVVQNFSDRVRFKARRQQQYVELRDRPPVTRDGHRISMQLNAGLLVDLPHLQETGADGIGLFRTELQFMISSTFPRLDRQTRIYRQILEGCDDKPVTFRALDIGGDKILPYLRPHPEENPALGWRAIRMSLDRPGMFRTQVRALLRAHGGREMRLMLPMVTDASEWQAAKALIAREIELLGDRPPPARILTGVMLEVPALFFQLDQVLPHVDFVSVGSNDLMQYLFAADRSNAKVSRRYDSLSPTMLGVLRTVVQATRRHEVPLALCGEMAGKPLEAMALIALGFRIISMPPASIGPVKSMILGLDVAKAERRLDELLSLPKPSLRPELAQFAREEGIEI
jgi:phosphotransferase system enzyme I (PtsP)